MSAQKDTNFHPQSSFLNQSQINSTRASNQNIFNTTDRSSSYLNPLKISTFGDGSSLNALKRSSIPVPNKQQASLRSMKKRQLNELFDEFDSREEEKRVSIGSEAPKQSNGSIFTNPTLANKESLSNKISSLSGIAQENEPKERYNAYKDRLNNFTPEPRKNDILSPSSTSDSPQSTLPLALETINQIQEDYSNPHLIDNACSSTLKGTCYECTPLTFLPKASYPIPDKVSKVLKQYQEEEVKICKYGFLDSHDLAYFFVNKKLVLWMFQPGQREQQIWGEFDFSQNVTCVEVIDSISSLGKLGQEESKKVLLVAIVSQLQYFYINIDPKSKKIELEPQLQPVHLPNVQINKIVQLKKNNRVFFGGSNGHLLELKMQDNSLSLLKPFVASKSHLRQVDHHQSIFSALIPSFLRFTEAKTLIDIQIDSQRSILYTLSVSLSTATQGQRIIEVFDLGLLGDQCDKIVTIKQHELVEKLHREQGKSHSLQGRNIYEEANHFKILNIYPLSFAEHSDAELLVITQNGKRLYIRFQTQQSQKLPTDDQIDKAKAQGEKFLTVRITGNWALNYKSFPDEKVAQEQNLQKKLVGLFKVNQLRHYKDNFDLGETKFCYNSFFNTLVYCNKVEDLMNEDYGADQSQIALNFITGNESGKNIYRQECRKMSQAPQIAEQCSFLTLQGQSQGEETTNFNKFPLCDDKIKEDEHILDIKFSFPKINPQNEELLGYNRKIYEKNFSSVYDITYSSLNFNEKTFFLGPPIIQLMTNKRIIEIVQLRPIDHLVNILQAMALTQTRRESWYYNLEDFIEQHGMREVAAMLVQISGDFGHQYLFSQRIEKLLKKQMEGELSQALKDKDLRFRQGQSINERSTLFKQDGIEGEMSFKFNMDAIGRDITYRSVTVDIRDLSEEMLMRYGDSFSRGMDFQHLKGIPDRTDFRDLSFKLMGTFMNISRSLRPVWDLKLAFYENYKQNVIVPTYSQCFIFVKNKLISFQHFLKKMDRKLAGDSLIFIQKNFLNSQTLSQNLIFFEELSEPLRNEANNQERSSLTALTKFIQVAINLLSFWELISFPGNSHLFKDFQKSLTPTIRESLISASFKDLFLPQTNPFISHCLYHICSFEKQYSSYFISNSIIKNLSNLFSQLVQGGNTEYLMGLRLLNLSRGEKPTKERDQNIAQGLDIIVKYAPEVNLSEICETLIEIDCYSIIVDICLRKLKFAERVPIESKVGLDKSNTQQIIDECQGVVMSLYSALEQSIKIHKKSSEEKQIGLEKGQMDYLDLFLSKFNQMKNLDFKNKLLDEIQQKIENYKDEGLIFTLYKHKMKKSRKEGEDLKNMPKINEEQFNYIFQSYIESKQVTLSELRNMVKELNRKKDSTRLGLMLGNLIENNIALIGQGKYSTEEIQIKIPFNEIMVFVNQTIDLLKIQKNEQNKDRTFDMENLLKEKRDQIQNQMNLINLIQQHIQAMKSTSSFPLIFKKDQKKEDLLNPYKNAFNVLQTSFFDPIKLQQFIEDNQICDAQMIQLINIFAEYDFSVQKDMSFDLAFQDLQNLFNGTIKQYQNIYESNWCQEIKRVVHPIQHIKHKGIAMKLLSVIAPLLSNQFQTEMKDDLILILSGNSLLKSKFALSEICYNYEYSKCLPSDLFRALADISFENIQESLSFEKVVNILAIYQMWLKLYSSITNSKGIKFDNNHLLNGDKNLKENFEKDMQRNAYQLWDQLLKKNIERYIRENEIQLEQSLADKMKKLYQDSVDGYEAMRKQLQIINPEQVDSEMRRRHQGSIQRGQEEQKMESLFGLRKLPGDTRLPIPQSYTNTQYRLRVNEASNLIGQGNGQLNQRNQGSQSRGFGDQNAQNQQQVNGSDVQMEIE